jgi:cellulose synthase/poly-beta-1,6-N-acetylglucosamine synthase-like glycosyltransferase
VCTGNAAYRRDAIRRVGMFDETMGYGYDNDMSYRLREAGYRLGFCREARALHKWREGGAGYFVQQYGLGYGRIDVVDRHRNRFAGDRVSPTMMMLHPIVLTAALLLVVMSAFAYAFDWPAVPLAAAAGALVAVLVIERLWAAASTVRRFGDRAAWLFPLVHLVRDLAWVTAIAVWLLRRLAGRPSRPSHSMQPRPAFAAVERRSVTNSL